MLGDDRAPQLVRIVRNDFFECCDFACRIVKWTADVNFTRVDLDVESKRMAQLIHTMRPARDAVIDRAPHRPEFAIQEIDMMAADFKPSTAIHARTPIAEAGD